MALVVSNDIYFFHRGNAQKAAHFVHHSFQSLGIKINMKIASIALLMVIITGCSNEGDWKEQKVMFDLTCKPIADIKNTLKGDAAFSDKLINFRYGTEGREYNVLLGEKFIINQLSPIAIMRGKVVPEHVYRLGGSEQAQRFSFTAERETMGAVIYTYQLNSGLLTEVYINFEATNPKNIEDGGTETVITSQSQCKQNHAEQ